MNSATKGYLDQPEETETWLTDALEGYQGEITEFRARPEAWEGGRTQPEWAKERGQTSVVSLWSVAPPWWQWPVWIPFTKIRSSFKSQCVFEFYWFSCLCRSGCVCFNGMQMGLIKSPLHGTLCLKFELRGQSLVWKVHIRQWIKAHKLRFIRLGQLIACGDGVWFLKRSILDAFGERLIIVYRQKFYSIRISSQKLE